MGAVDDVVKPIPVPELKPENEIAKQRHRAAELRKTLRREFAQRYVVGAPEVEKGEQALDLRGMHGGRLEIWKLQL